MINLIYFLHLEQGIQDSDTNANLHTGSAIPGVGPLD